MKTSEKSVGESSFSLQGHSFFKAEIPLCTILLLRIAIHMMIRIPRAITGHDCRLQIIPWPGACYCLCLYAICVASIGLRCPILPRAASLALGACMCAAVDPQCRAKQRKERHYSSSSHLGLIRCLTLNRASICIKFQTVCNKLGNPCKSACPMA